jgi:hypothetical protein
MLKLIKEEVILNNDEAFLSKKSYALKWITR